MSYKYIGIVVALITMTGCAGDLTRIKQEPLTPAQMDDLGAIAVVSATTDEYEIHHHYILIAGTCRESLNLEVEHKSIYEKAVNEFFSTLGYKSAMSEDFHNYVGESGWLSNNFADIEFGYFDEMGIDSILTITPADIEFGQYTYKKGAGVYSDLNPFNKVLAVFAYNSVAIELFDVKSEKLLLGGTIRYLENIGEDTVSYEEVQECDISNVDDLAKQTHVDTAKSVVQYLGTMIKKE